MTKRNSIKQRRSKTGAADSEKEGIISKLPASTLRLNPRIGSKTGVHLDREAALSHPRLTVEFDLKINMRDIHHMAIAEGLPPA
jgi:hypothetical protein